MQRMPSFVDQVIVVDNGSTDRTADVAKGYGAQVIHEEVRGYGRQKGQKEIYRGAEYTIAFVPKLKIEVAVASERAEETINAIQNAARTGKVGDGKIFVLDLLQALRVRTGETDGDAL